MADISELIPKKVPEYIPRKMYGTTDVELMKAAYESRSPVILVGRTGSGKTHLVKYIAALYGKPYIRLSFANGMTLEDLLGYNRIISGDTVWEDGFLPYCMKNGIIFFADEINFLDPEVAAVFNSILDDDRQLVNTLHGKEIIKPHPDFWFVAAMNSGIQYAGTKDMNEALIDRFEYYMEFDYPSMSIEKKIVKSRIPDIDDRVLNVIYEIFRQARNEFSDYNIDISTRLLLRVCRLSDKLGIENALKLSLYPKLKSRHKREALNIMVKKIIPPDMRSNIDKSIKNTIEDIYDVSIANG